MALVTIIATGSLFALSTSVSATPVTHAFSGTPQEEIAEATEAHIVSHELALAEPSMSELETIAPIEPNKTEAETKNVEVEEPLIEQDVPFVPFFSQFADISDPKWRKVGCGVASLAMLIEFYRPGSVSVDTLLDEGIASGAYLNNAGWTHKGLADLANNYGLMSAPHDLSSMSMDTAFSEIRTALKEGPVIASVHYTFDPKNPIPHLVVINGIEDDIVHYNDPAESSGGGTISAEKFMQAWKKRYIDVRQPAG